MAKVIPVILAGGVGSRLWPLSREEHPKPFIKLEDGQSLIQKAFLRAASLDNVQEVVTVTNRKLYFYTKDEYEEVNNKEIYNTFILEPFGRNSTAAIGMAANYAYERYGKGCILLILAADHLIGDQKAFQEAFYEAKNLAEVGEIVTFGIKPNSPKTGYGYIKADGDRVIKFIEKPCLEKAKVYCESGEYLWNSGMFCVKAEEILKSIEEFCPNVSQGVENCFEKAHKSSGNNYNQIEIKPDDFGKLEDISIDYAVLEKAKNIAVVACDIQWSDIGSWIEFGNMCSVDMDNNHICGNVITNGVRDCIIYGKERLIAGIGLKDLIVADTKDAILIASKDKNQEVKEIVKHLKNQNHEAYKTFPEVHRPWGKYTNLYQGIGFKVKVIEVESGAALSLQSHNHRSEHWVVVSGIASVTNNGDLIELHNNQSTYIPVGAKHRLENKGKEKLVLIEVQCGSYLGEDDIIRYEDLYNR